MRAVAKGALDAIIGRGVVLCMEQAEVHDAAERQGGGGGLHAVQRLMEDVGRPAGVHQGVPSGELSLSRGVVGRL